jgi:hypothetical protein
MHVMVKESNEVRKYAHGLTDLMRGLNTVALFSATFIHSRFHSRDYLACCAQDVPRIVLKCPLFLANWNRKCNVLISVSVTSCHNKKFGS